LKGIKIMEFVVATNCKKLIMLKKYNISMIRPEINGNTLSVKIYIDGAEGLIECTLDADFVKNITPKQLVDISCDLIRRNTVNLDSNEYSDPGCNVQKESPAPAKTKLNRDEVCKILSRLFY
jgi:hypothetical protein